MLNVAASVNDPQNPNSAVAIENAAYKNMVAAHNSRIDHPGYDTSKADLEFKAASDRLTKMKAGLDAMSKSVGNALGANPPDPATSPGVRPGPPVRGPAAVPGALKNAVGSPLMDQMYNQGM